MNLRRKTLIYLGCNRIQGWNVHFRLASDAGYIQAEMMYEEELILNPKSLDKSFILEVVPFLWPGEVEDFNRELRKLYNEERSENHWLAKSFDNHMPVVPWYSDSCVTQWVENVVKYSDPVPSGELFLLENYDDDSKNLGSWKVLE